MATGKDRTVFDPTCRQCDRLARYLDEVRSSYPSYHCNPVSAFGDANARLLIVGLAPGKHGANATGRPFTGDYAGILLYRTLHKFGFASAGQSEHAQDGLRLTNCRITNAVKCLPPENKPTGEEIAQCNRYLRAELDCCGPGTIVLALGAIAHRAVLKACGLTQARFPFRHAHVYPITDQHTLLDSYHCSRYNTQTGRLTVPMFERVFELAGDLMQ